MLRNRDEADNENQIEEILCRHCGHVEVPPQGCDDHSGETLIHDPDCNHVLSEGADDCDCADADGGIDKKLAALEAEKNFRQMSVEIPERITVVCPYRGCRHSNELPTTPMGGFAVCELCDRAFSFELKPQLHGWAKRQADQPDDGHRPIKAIERYDDDYLASLAPEVMDGSQLMVEVVRLRAKVDDLNGSLQRQVRQ